MNVTTKKPLKYLEYDYADAMFELTLADGSQLLVSPEHKVYGLILNQSSIISNPSSSTTNNFPLNSLTSCKSKDKAFTSFSGIGGWILNTMIPENSLGGYKRVLKKSESLVISTDLFSLDKDIISVFLTPFGPYTVGNPSCSKNHFTDFGTYPKDSLIIPLFKLEYSSKILSIGTPAASNSIISLTNILVPLKIGFPWQTSGSAMISLII